MKLFAVHARYLMRKSRTDPGRLGVWLVNASSPERARALWHAAQVAEASGLWEFESVAPHAKPVVRVL